MDTIERNTNASKAEEEESEIEGVKERKTTKKAAVEFTISPGTRGKKKYITDSDAYKTRVSKDGEAFGAGEVLENKLYIGNLQDARNVDALKRNRFTHVLTCAQRLRVYGRNGEKTPPFLLSHAVLPLADHPNQDILTEEGLGRAISFIGEALDHERGKILVHCASGVSRSVSMVVGYLIQKRKIGYEEALTFVRKGRSRGCPNFGFQHQLREFANASGNVHKSHKKFREKLDERGMTLVRLAMIEREAATAFHHKFERLEKKHGAGEIKDMDFANDLRGLLEKITLTRNGWNESGFCDRPANSIAKSAEARIRVALSRLSDG